MVNIKYYIFIILLFFNTFVFAEKIKSISDENAKINIARIIKVINLLDKEQHSLIVNIVVEDLGGASDVSLTQVIYLTMYSKGELYSVDVTFKITTGYSFVSAKRFKPGIYEVVVLDEGLKNKKFVIDAKKVSNDIQNIKGCDDPTCKAVINFSGLITVN